MKGFLSFQSKKFYLKSEREMKNHIQFLVFMSEDHNLFYKVGFISFREFVALAKENKKANFYFKISIR